MKKIKFITTVFLLIISMRVMSQKYVAKPIEINMDDNKVASGCDCDTTLWLHTYTEAIDPENHELRLHGLVTIAPCVEIHGPPRYKTNEADGDYSFKIKLDSSACELTKYILQDRACEAIIYYNSLLVKAGAKDEKGVSIKAITDCKEKLFKPTDDIKCEIVCDGQVTVPGDILIKEKCHGCPKIDKSALDAAGTNTSLIVKGRLVLDIGSGDIEIHPVSCIKKEIMY